MARIDVIEEIVSPPTRRLERRKTFRRKFSDVVPRQRIAACSVELDKIGIAFAPILSGNNQLMVAHRVLRLR